jgi:hypothetical protein
LANGAVEPPGSGCWLVSDIALAASPKTPISHMDLPHVLVLWVLRLIVASKPKIIKQQQKKLKKTQTQNTKMVLLNIEH